jgi:hypothetical protein
MLTEQEIRAYKYLIQIESLINGYHQRESSHSFRFVCILEELTRAMQNLKQEIGTRLIEEWKNKED